MGDWLAKRAKTRARREKRRRRRRGGGEEGGGGTPRWNSWDNRTFNDLFNLNNEKGKPNLRWGHQQQQHQQSMTKYTPLNTPIITFLFLISTSSHSVHGYNGKSIHQAIYAHKKTFQSASRRVGSESASVCVVHGGEEKRKKKLGSRDLTREIDRLMDLSETCQY